MTLSVSFQKTNAGGLGLMTKYVRFKLDAESKKKNNLRDLVFSMYVFQIHRFPKEFLFSSQMNRASFYLIGEFPKDECWWIRTDD